METGPPAGALVGGRGQGLGLIDRPPFPGLLARLERALFSVCLFLVFAHLQCWVTGLSSTRLGI